MNWIAYCMSCREIIDSCPNGNFVEASARLHREGKPLWKRGCEGEPPPANLIPGGNKKHRVIVGYFCPEDSVVHISSGEAL